MRKEESDLIKERVEQNILLENERKQHEYSLNKIKNTQRELKLKEMQKKNYEQLKKKVLIIVS
jgi:hypothetical protein